MSETIRQPKGRLTLDMGWRTAAAMLLFFWFCLLATVAGLWRIFTAAPISLKISWWTFLLLIAVSCFAVKVQQRAARYAAVLLALSCGSRILLVAIHASPAVQVFNAEITRVIDALIMTGLCIWIVTWFKPRVSRI
jgi:hypothetical protein